VSANIKYKPLKDNEQEVLLRMIEGQNVYVEIEGWGYHTSPEITAGDKRVQVRFPMKFTKPEGVYVPVSSFTLVLKTREGREIFRDVKSTYQNWKPLMITAGTVIDLIWDIALASISPEFQRLIMPGVKGKEVMSIRNGDVLSEE